MTTEGQSGQSGAGAGAGGGTAGTRKKTKAQTRYIAILVGDGGKLSKVLFDGKGKSEESVFEFVTTGTEIEEGKHKLIVASVRLEREVEVATKRVVSVIGKKA